MKPVGKGTMQYLVVAISLVLAITGVAASWYGISLLGRPEQQVASLSAIVLGGVLMFIAGFLLTLTAKLLG